MCNNPGKTNSKDVFGTMNLSPCPGLKMIFDQLIGAF
jgi:hypothetical protein